MKSALSQVLLEGGSLGRLVVVAGLREGSQRSIARVEIKRFLSGLRDHAPVGPRWKKLAAKKLSEVEHSITRSVRLKTLLEKLLHCRCASLNRCVTALGLSENLRLVANRLR